MAFARFEIAEHGLRKHHPYIIICRNSRGMTVAYELGLHLLAHLWDTPAEVAADVAPSRIAVPVPVPGARRRVVVAAVAFIVGITLATAAMPVSQWQQSRPPGLHHRDG